MNNLSMKEIMSGYFENGLYGDHFNVNDPETVKTIREYMDEKGIVDMDAVNRLISLANPVENAGMGEIIEYAFKLLELTNDYRSKEVHRIQNYLIAIENLISMSDHSNFINDLEILRGEEHLAFVIDLLNRRFADPETRRIYEKQIFLFISGQVIGKLFFKYVLDNVIKESGVKFGAANFILEENFLHSLCCVGIEKLPRYYIDFEDIIQLADYGIELHNVLEIIIRKGYYKENGQSRDIEKILTSYILFGFRKELEKLIINADETLLNRMISAWSNLIMRSRDIMFPREMREYIPSIIEFLCNIKVDKLSCCKTEWSEMINSIK